MNTKKFMSTRKNSEALSDVPFNFTLTPRALVYLMKNKISWFNVIFQEPFRLA